MKKQLPKRNELDVKYTWDMSNLFKTEALYQDAFDSVEKEIDLFRIKYESKLDSKEVINEALTTYQNIQAKLSRISAYSSLQTSTDSVAEANQMRQGKAMVRFQNISKKMLFFNTELKQAPNDLLLQASKLNENNKCYLEEIIVDKQYTLSPEVEKSLGCFIANTKRSIFKL